VASEKSDATSESVPPGSCGFTPGANPTILSYNASTVKIYNAASRQVCFENSINLLLLLKTLLPTTALVV
jgi:hypothetical protein